MKFTDKQKTKFKEKIIGHIAKNPKITYEELAQKIGLSRQTISLYVKQLLSENILEKQGENFIPKVNTFSFAHNFNRVKNEDALYIKNILPIIKDEKENVLKIISYGFSEIVNNVIDHSNAKKITYSVSISPLFIDLCISDNGVGIFNKIKNSLQLDESRFSILELVKGKFTTDKKHHSGEGIFFTSRSFDEFSISSEKLEYLKNQQGDFLIDLQKKISGTRVKMKIKKNSKRTLKEVFDFYASLDTIPSFYKTKIPMKLMESEGMKLISRSQAKRLCSRLENFLEIILDFSNVDDIGQAFSDELFRVFQNKHPKLKITAINCSNEITKMIMHVKNAQKIPG